MFFFNRNKDIANKFETFFSASKVILGEFYKSLEYVCNKGLDNHFEVMVEKISEMEKEADDIKREIEFKMVSNSLLPETREDLLEIIYLMDNIPDHCEKIVYIINDQKTVPHEDIKKNLIELTKVGIECFEFTLKAAYDFFDKRENLTALVKKADECEHVGDKLERRMIQKIFSLKIGTGKQLIQKEIVTEIGEICDISKHIAMRIFAASIKRKI
jgi:uncharacterized protein